MIPCLYLQAERENQTKTERNVIHISCFFFFLNQIHNTREMQSLKLIGGAYFPGYIQIFKEKKRPMQGNHEFKRSKRPLDLNLVPHESVLTRSFGSLFASKGILMSQVR